MTSLPRGTPKRDDLGRCSVPGSRIEYFFTSNYFATPNNLYYLPDTTGGNFFEFEVLPGVGPRT